jgi:hypothetical protein
MRVILILLVLSSCVKQHEKKTCYCNLVDHYRNGSEKQSFYSSEDYSHIRDYTDATHKCQMENNKTINDSLEVQCHITYN